MLFLRISLPCLTSLWLFIVPFCSVSLPAILGILSNFTHFPPCILSLPPCSPIFFFFLPLLISVFFPMFLSSSVSVLFPLLFLFFPPCFFSPSFSFWISCLDSGFLSVSLVSFQSPSLECWQKRFFFIFLFFFL